VVYNQSIKQKILELLKEGLPRIFPIGEIAKQVVAAWSMASTWLKVLSSEGRIEIECSEEVKDIIFRFKGEH
jgi:hypothetical protein